jgi:hypothetical protein
VSFLQQIVDKLTVTEAKAVTGWLAAELHNRRVDCRTLFQLRIADLPLPSPTAEFAAIYPGEAYDAARHRQLEHQLLKRLEDFLAWEAFRRDTHAPDEYLLKAYRDRNLDDHRRTRLRRYQPAPTMGTDRLRLEYFMAVERYELDLRTSRGGKVDYLAPEHTLEAYLLGLRLRQTVMTIAHQRLHKTTDEYEVPRLDSLLVAAGQPIFQRDPFVSLYHLVVRLQLGKPNDEQAAFTQLTQRIVDVSHQLTPEDQRTVLIAAINYGLRHANTGYEPGVAATFTLYKLGLERRTIHHNGRLSIFAFNNILALALRLREVDWAAAFLDKHQHELPEKGGGEVLALSRARLALATGDDGEALFLLQQADFKDFIHHLTARVMQLKIYFRQDSYTLLHSHIGSTRKLLTRRKRVGYHLQNYRNIFQLANAVIRLAPGDDKARTALRERILATEPCTERPWLLEVCGEMLRR